jgi:hypothetical protein
LDKGDKYQGAATANMASNPLGDSVEQEVTSFLTVLELLIFSLKLSTDRGFKMAFKGVKQIFLAAATLPYVFSSKVAVLQPTPPMGKFLPARL